MTYRVIKASTILRTNHSFLDSVSSIDEGCAIKHANASA